MTLYIVTIKQRNIGHDPSNKKTGECLTSRECTDSTGHHHSYLVEADSIKAIIEDTKVHITRIEIALPITVVLNK